MKRLSYFMTSGKSRNAIIGTACVALLSCVIINGCGLTESESDDATEGNASNTSNVEASLQESQTYDGSEVTTIGISMPAEQLERWHTDAALLQNLFEEAGYDVLISYGDNLIDTQIKEINQMIDNGADLLVIAPVDSDSLSTCIKKANENNVPIVAYDRLINHDPNLLAYVSYDNYLIGQLQAQFIVDNLDIDNSISDISYNIELFSGDAADNNAMYLYNGSMSVLDPYIKSGKLKVVSNQKDFYSCSTTSWSTEIAEEKMQIILASFYNDTTKLDAVLCPNDSIAIGICDSITSSYHQDNNVIITGQDCDSANIPYIQDGRQNMSIYKSLDNEALATFYIIQNYLNGTSTGDDLSAGLDSNITITRDTTSYVSDNTTITAYLLTPEIITSENIDEWFSSNND